MSDKDKISPYSINTISSRQVIRIKKNIIRGLLIKTRPISPNYLHKSCMVDSKENHSRDLGGERVKLEIIPQILQTYWHSFPFILAKRASCEDRRSKKAANKSK